MPKKLTEEEIKTKKEFLISELKSFYNINKRIPTSREMRAKNGHSSEAVFRKYFGSLGSACLEAGLEIPNEKKWLYERERYSDKYMLECLKRETDLKIENNGAKLLTFEEIDKNSNMPSALSYSRRWGSIENIYLQINVEYSSKNKELLKNDMINNYKQLAFMIGKSPNSRDIDRASRVGISRYAAKCYSENFGSLHSLYELAGLTEEILIENNSNEHLKLIRSVIGEANKDRTGVFEYSNIPGIYCLRLSVNEKVYIGQSKDLYSRLKHHFTSLARKRHCNKRLQNDWNKYGFPYFELSILDIVDKQLLNEKEEFWIEHFNSTDKDKGYNILKYAGAPKEYKLSDEVKLYLKQIKNKKVIQFSKNGKLKYTFDNVFVASGILGIRASYISSVCREEWHTTNGFIFIFEEDYLKDKTIIDRRIKSKKGNGGRKLKKETVKS